MFKEGQLVTTIGTFVVKEITEEYVEFDPYGKGTVGGVKAFAEQGFQELNADGTVKDFDGFQVGDFFQLTGNFKVLHSNILFTRVEVEGQLVSLPNHKLQEVVAND